MQPVSFLFVQQSPVIHGKVPTNSFSDSTSPVTIQPGSVDSFQRFSGISAARKIINEGEEIHLLYWAWLKSSRDRATCLANDGKGITDQAIAAVLVIEDLVTQGLTDIKRKALYKRGIAHHTVAHMLRQKLTSQEIVTLLDKALKDDAVARQLQQTLTVQQLREIINPTPASNTDDMQIMESIEVPDSTEVASSPKATPSKSTNDAIQPKDPRGLSGYQYQVDGEEGRALPETALEKLSLEDRVAYARFEFDRKNKLIRDLVRRKGKDKIAAHRWDVPLDQIKQA